ncbi:MAG TPA: extensin family protein [Polyangiaceae bacterium]
MGSVRRAAVQAAFAVCALACVRPDDAPQAYPAQGYPQGYGAPYGGAYGHAPVYAPAPAYAAAPAPAPPPAPTGTPAFYDPDPQGRPTPILRPDAPAMRYAAMDGASCEAELTRRGVPFARGEPTDGVTTPERLRGPLHGVTISTGAPAAVVARSPMEIFDCRLVLALDDFAAMAATRGIVAMQHISAYRSKAAHGCTEKYVGLQHCGALAVDIASFRLADGTSWNVQRDFHGSIGAGTCGPGAFPAAPTAASTGLHALVCDAADRGIFNVMLTPNHNAEHFNHFHVEVTPGAEWMMIH